MRRRWAALLVCAAVLLVVVAARFSEERAPRPSTRTILDATGNRVEIPAVVNRVACAGALNQVILMLGAADRIVATSAVIQKNPWFLRAFPAIVDKPAPYGVGSPLANEETLVATRPDVVFGGPGQPATSRVPVVGVSLENAEGIKRTIRVVAEVLGGDAVRRAQDFVSYYDDVVTRVRRGVAGIPPEGRVRVLTASGRGYLQTDGRRSIATEWIDVGGGVNVAASAIPTPSGAVTMEDVLRWDPEVVFTTSPGDRDGILAEPRWAHVSAVKNRRVFASPRGVYLWAVRSGEGALQYFWAAKAMNPERFQDVDLVFETRTFYRRFYGLEIDEHDVETILNPTD